jgi:hypothetical protein
MNGQSHLAFAKNRRLALIPADTCAKPTLVEASPSTWSSLGGDSVVLTGTNLLTATSIHFGLVPVPIFTIDSDTQITATAPAGTDGTEGMSIVTETRGGTAVLVAEFVGLTTDAGELITTESDEGIGV